MTSPPIGLTQSHPANTHGHPQAEALGLGSWRNIIAGGVGGDLICMIGPSLCQSMKRGMERRGGSSVSAVGPQKAGLRDGVHHGLVPSPLDHPGSMHR